jgi:hypothetical protein
MLAGDEVRSPARRSRRSCPAPAHGTGSPRADGSMSDPAPAPALRLGDRTTAASLARLGKDPRASVVRELSLLGCPLRDAGARALAAGKHFTGIVSLNLGMTRLSDAGLAAVAGAPQLRTVERLDLSSNPIEGTGLDALLAPGSFPRLSTLKINSEALSTGGLTRLLSSELAARLTTLDLEGAQLDDRAVEAIAAARTLASLTDLRLRTNRVGAAGAAALASSPLASQLLRLELGHNSVGAEGIRALATSRRLGGLRCLGLRDTMRGREAFGLLCRSETLEALVDLDVSANQLTDAEIALLAAAPRWSNLSRLVLDWNPIGPDAAIALAKSSTLTNLKVLHLGSPTDTMTGSHTVVGIRDAGARALAGSAALAGLLRLDLTKNEIGDEGALAIAASSPLAGLQQLEMKWNCLGAKGQAAIQERFGERASVVYQRSSPPPPSPALPASPSPPAPPSKPRKKVAREAALVRLNAKSAFAPWRRAIDAPIISAAEAISRETIDALLALEGKATRTAERRILRRFVARFDALDRSAPFIGTTEVEDIAARFDDIRAHTALAHDDGLFDEWRDF